jgi:hypothetical protein
MPRKRRSGNLRLESRDPARQAPEMAPILAGLGGVSQGARQSLQDASRRAALIAGLCLYGLL